MAFFDGGGSAAKFPTPGTTVTGTLTRPYREVQAMKFGTQTPDTWPDGSPKMQAVIDLQTTERDPANPDDDGTRTLYVSSTKMRRAIADAIKKAGASDLEPGGTLTVTFTGFDPQSKNPAQPAKLYTASYLKPTGTFTQPEPASTPGSIQNPTYAQPQAAPSGLNPDQESKVRHLLSMSLTDEQIAAALSIAPTAVAGIRAAA